MAPKKAPKGKSNKTIEKAKQKIVEDKTFGLKNKNKSKVVQKQVASISKQVLNSGGRKGAPNPNEERKKKKEEAEAYKKECMELFKPALSKKEKEAERAKKLAAKEAKEAKEKGEVYEKAEPEEYLWNADDFDEVEEDESRLEEQLQKELEEVREKLATEGGGTPVTEQSFAKWKDEQRKKAQATEKKNKAKMKATGKFTGRALFEHDASLFVDDAAGFEVYEREEEEEEEGEGKAAEGAAEGAASSGAIDASLFQDELEVEDLDDEDDDEEE